MLFIDFDEAIEDEQVAKEEYVEDIGADNIENCLSVIGSIINCPSSG